MSVSNILGFMIEFLENSSVIITYLQIVGYVMLILLFGKICTAGYRNYIPYWTRLYLRAVLGFLVLFSGISISNLVYAHLEHNRLVSLSRIDIIAGCLLSTTVITLAVYLISRNIPNTNGIKKAIEKLEARLSRARKSPKGLRAKLRNPVILLGTAIIIAISVFSALNFRYVNLADKVYSELGTSHEEVSLLLNTAKTYSSANSGVSPDMIELAAFINNMLPVVLPLVQGVAYLFFALIFGWICMTGYVTKSPRPVRAALRLGLGFLSLFCGIALSPWIVFSDIHTVQAVLEMLQLNVLVAGVISSIIIGIGVFLISVNIFNISGIKKSIKEFREKLKKAKEREGKKPFYLQTTSVIGITLLLGLIIFSAVNFSGFPDMPARFDEAISYAGIPKEDLINQMKFLRHQSMEMEKTMNRSEVSGECPDLYDVLLTNYETLLKGELTPYNNSDVQSLIESGSGAGVIGMFELDYRNQRVILAVTTDKRICLATAELFCGCMNIPENIQGI